MNSQLNARHWKTQALADVFSLLPENDPTSYDDLSVLSKLDVGSVKRVMRSARNIVLTEKSIIIDNVRGFGVIRLDQSQVLKPVAVQRRRMRNAARRGIRLIRNGVTDFDALGPDQKSTLYMERAVFGAVVLFTAPSSRRVLKEHAANTGSSVSVGRTLELFSSRGKNQP